MIQCRTHEQKCFMRLMREAQKETAKRGDGDAARLNAAQGCLLGVVVVRNHPPLRRLGGDESRLAKLGAQCLLRALIPDCATPRQLIDTQVFLAPLGRLPHIHSCPLFFYTKRPLLLTPTTSFSPPRICEIRSATQLTLSS